MNFYKITNKEENHNGMQYKTGLNVDILPFNPSGSCTPGGIYFASEDILAFLNYGENIRKVTIPEGEKIYKDRGHRLTKYKAHRVILGRKKKITTKVIKELLDEGVDIHTLEDKALRWASEYGHIEIVKLLLDRGADIHAEEDEPLRYASYNGHTEVVKLLLDRGADVHAEEDEPLRWASENGYIEIVKLLKKYLKKKNN